MYVNTFETIYAYGDWLVENRGEVQVISTTTFKDRLVVTFNLIEKGV